MIDRLQRGPEQEYVRVDVPEEEPGIEEKEVFQTENNREAIKVLSKVELPEGFSDLEEQLEPNELQHVQLAELRKIIESNISAKIKELLSSGEDMHLEGPFMRELSSIMMHAQDVQDAVKKWRNVVERIGTGRGDNSEIELTDRQRRVLLMRSKGIEEIYEDINKALNEELELLEQSPEDSLVAEIAERIVNTHHWNDRYEAEDPEKSHRTLEGLRKSGMGIFLAPKRESHQKITPAEARERARARLREAVEESDETGVPVVEIVKNERLLSVNRFPGSKISQAAHDLMDHYWTYDRMDREGIFDRYEGFFESIGSPQNTDMFNREGEMLASISHDWRASHYRERQFSHRISADMIREKLARYEGQVEDQQVLENVQRAREIVESLMESGNDEELQRVEIVFNGMLVELMEQRRKHGYIKMLNEEGEPIRNMRLIEPESIALVVEVTNLLSSDEASEEFQTVLTNFEIQLEKYLRVIANEPQKMNIKIEDLSEYNPEEDPDVSPELIAWLNANPHHISTREQVR